MQKIPLKRATAGMVLAKDVFRNDSPIGIPVCGMGTVLTDILIARLDNMDVHSIYVEGHPVWEEGDHSLDDMLRDLDRRFEKVRHDPLMSRIYDIYADHLRRSLGDDNVR
jgi:hypothetical protein